MILGKNFLMQVKVSILSYLGKMEFMERGKPCIVMTIREEDAID